MDIPAAIDDYESFRLQGRTTEAISGPKIYEQETSSRQPSSG
jgi:hypothetical protein